jgi:hypothetical protein
MNHYQIYNAIIQNSKIKNRKKINKNENNYLYYENHHIIPRCLSGSDDKENLVLLTAKEHYICHKLLTYIYPKNRKIVDAFFRMTFDKRGNINISSSDYAYARELKTLTPMSEETRKKLSKSRKKFFSEHTNPLLGRKRPDFGKNQIGEKNPMFGKHLSKNAKEKLSKFWTGKPRIFKQIVCEYCNKTSNPGNYKQWHGENCKLKP